MNTEIIQCSNTTVCIINSRAPLITDVQSALDLMITLEYQTRCTNIAINKEAICEDFFVLSTCLTDEILQKFVNYGVRFAIYDYFSSYHSKSLKDFIDESKHENYFYFQPSVELALINFVELNKTYTSEATKKAVV